MSDLPLPPCRHRGAQFAPGRWTCASPQLVIPGRIVTADVCTSLCPVVDHPPKEVARRGGRGDGAADGASAAGVRRVALRPNLLAIGMITAPRCVRTVDLTIAELRRAGFAQTIHVYAEPGSGLLSCPGVNVVRHRRRKGLWRNWLFAAHALLAETRAPFLLLCEDDVRLCPAAAWALQYAIDTLPHEDWGYASLYTPRHNLVPPGPRRSTGWVALDHGRHLWGALAYSFTRDGLKALLAHRAVRHSPPHSHTDWVVSDVLRSLGRRCYFHLPSVGDHSGQGVSSAAHVSVAEMAGVRYAADYRGYVPMLTANLPGKLAVVSVLFHAKKYRSFVRNYERFAAGLASQGVDLWTMEVAVRGQTFELPRAKRLLRARAADALWQGERALTALIRKLPPEYDKIAWVDADVLLTNRNWARDAARLLRAYPLVQCFSYVQHLGPQDEPLPLRQPALAKVAADRGIDRCEEEPFAAGYAWAGRREWLERHGLYDRVVVGGGDAAMIAGWYNWWGHPAFRLWPAALLDDLHHWAKGVWADVQGRVGYVDGEALHLFHGPLSNRRYHERYAILGREQFHPRQDLRRLPNGLWAWNSAKPRLHRAVRKYFDLRRDDEGSRR